MKKRIVLIGGGGHAKVLACIIKKLADFELIGYTDLVDKGDLLGLKYLGDDDVLKKLRSDGLVVFAALGIGKTEKNAPRRMIMSKLLDIGFTFPPIISPFAMVNEDVSFGTGTAAFDGVVVNSGSRIADGVILNTNSTIEHDCFVGSYSHIAPGAVVCGGSEIGEGCLIGANSTVIPGVRIGANVILGAGSVAVKDCLVPGIYIGSPAKLKDAKI